MIAAALIYNLIPLWNRTAIADGLGFAASGHYSLAYDLSAKLVQTVGSALDILLFQIAVRTERDEGPEAAKAQIGTNMGLVLAATLAVSLGVWLVLPSLEATVVPQAFRGPFGEVTTLLLPGLACYTLAQAAVTPVFQLQKRTWPAVAAAFAGLVLNGALVLALGSGATIGSYVTIQSAAYAWRWSRPDCSPGGRCRCCPRRPRRRRGRERRHGCGGLAAQGGGAGVADPLRQRRCRRGGLRGDGRDLRSRWLPVAAQAAAVTRRPRATMMQPAITSAAPTQTMERGTSAKKT